MVSEISFGKFVSISEDLSVEPVSCSIDHYIETIVGNSVAKLLNVDPHGRMSVKLKAISSFYPQMDKNDDIPHFRGDVAHERMFFKQNYRVSMLNNFFNGRHPDTCTNLVDSESTEFCEIPDTDDMGHMTLKEFHLQSKKAKKLKVRRKLSDATTSFSEGSENESHSNIQMKVEEPDLNQPIISFRRKSLKRCMEKADISKIRKLHRSDTQISSSVKMEDTSHMQNLCLVKKEMVECDDSECVVENITDTKNYSDESFHCLPQSMESELQTASDCCESTKPVNGNENFVIQLDFHEEQGLCKFGAGIYDSCIVSHSIVEEPISTSPETSEVPDKNMLVLASLESCEPEVTGDSSHLMLSIPQDGFSQQHCMNCISGNANETAEALPSDQPDEMGLVASFHNDSDTSMTDQSSNIDENCTDVGLLCVEATFVNDTEVSDTSKDSFHLLPQFAQCNARGASVERMLEIPNCLPTESSVLQCSGDDLGPGTEANPLEMTESIKFSASNLELEMNERNSSELARIPLSEGLDHVSFSSSNNQHVFEDYGENMDPNKQEHKDFQMNCMNSMSDFYMDGSQHTTVQAEYAHNGSINNDTYNHYVKDAWENANVLGEDTKNNGLTDHYCSEVTECVWDENLPSCEVVISESNAPAVNEDCLINLLPSTETPGSDFENTGRLVVASHPGKIEIGANQCSSHYTPDACSSDLKGFLVDHNATQDVPHSMPVGVDFNMNIPCKNLQEQKGTETQNFCKGIKPIQPPRRLPSNRKIFSPTSKEQLYQTLDATELYESMRYYRNKRRIWSDKGLDSLCPSEGKEAESKYSPEKKIVKPRNDSNIAKTILKSANNSSLRVCNMPDGSLPISQSQDAIKFSQRQMHDIDSVTEKLLTTLRSMKCIMGEALHLEEFASTHLKGTAEKMMTAIEEATATEGTTQKYMSMMNRDFKRFCRIMRSRENNLADKSNGVAKKQKKITFADEAGGLLCHVRVFEEASSDLDSGGIQEVPLPALNPI